MNTAFDRPHSDVGLNTAEEPASCEWQPPAVGLATLIVEGPDAGAEARKYTPAVRLASSANDAMALAAAYKVLALVGAGYRSPDAETVRPEAFRDGNPDTSVLRLHRSWESPGPLMCLAVHRDLARHTAPRTVAIPPHAQVFASQYVGGAQPVTVGSKPVAARVAAHGEVAACITSVAAAARYPALESCIEWQPTVLWRLYGPADGIQG